MTGRKLQNQQKTIKKTSPEKNEEEYEEFIILEEDTEKSDETSGTNIKNSDESSSSVLTENLSPWRAAAHLHAKACRAKFLQEYGEDLHLHSDDSDTMIKLKEKITPSCAQLAEKERMRMNKKKESKSIPTAFDEWLQKKDNELKQKKMHRNKEQEIRELREAAEKAKQAKKRSDKVEKWRKNRQHLDNEKKAIEKIKERNISESQYITDIKSNSIPASEWEKIRQAAEDMKNIEPLKLGLLEGQGHADPGKYLTKYVVQPDPAFRARYKHILEAEEARPTEIILDGDQKEGMEDPADLPRRFKHMLREEAKKLKEYLNAGDSWNKGSSEHSEILNLSPFGSEHFCKPKSSRKSKSKMKPTERRKPRASRVSSVYSLSCLKKYSV